MTRKHYILIANTLGAEMYWERQDKEARDVIYLTAKALASALKTDNPRFDTTRFLEHVLDVAEGRRDLDGKKAAQ
jgi:hypothetical protein